MVLVASEMALLAHLLPEEHVGVVSVVELIAVGLSGARVYAVSSTRGELVLRVNAGGANAARWAQQLRVLRRAAAHGIAPAIVHVDDTARAIVSTRAPGVPLVAGLMDPGQRSAAIASVVDQLRALHAIDVIGIEERDPLVHAYEHAAAQRRRPGFPAWAAALDPVFDSIATTLARDPRRVVSHNDLNPANVLWDGARAWLVDWEVAGLAHPFYDLAVLAMFLQLDDAAALGLLARQEQRPVDDVMRATFAALRRLAALFCGLVFASLVPDLNLLPASGPSLSEFYAGLRAGRLDLRDPGARAAFALALLRLGTAREAAQPAGAPCS
ncbi:MAG: aminoglycoside phosphotransferase family protein [Myxococcota bacterium]|nr:aminoglycoside phosphotransferase family protein [Myxococcota bacterium]